MHMAWVISPPYFFQRIFWMIGDSRPFIGKTPHRLRCSDSVQQPEHHRICDQGNPKFHTRISTVHLGTQDFSAMANAVAMPMQIAFKKRLPT